MIYVDGTGLCRFLPGVRFFDEFNDFTVPRLAELATTQLGFTELRQAAELYPRETKTRAFEVLEMVRGSIPVIRFSEHTVSVSTHASAVLKPFAALHLGAAVAHPDVTALLTYDAELARVAELYELQVLSPGLMPGWYGPS